MGHPLARSIPLQKLPRTCASTPRPTHNQPRDKKDAEKATEEEGAFTFDSSEPCGKIRLGCQCPGRNAVDDRQRKTMCEQELSTSQAIPRHGLEETIGHNIRDHERVCHH